jgi:hypothetical protein
VRDGPRFRGLPVLGIAVAGLALGHLTSYAIVFPDPHNRDLVLQGSEHAYLPALAQIALILAVAGVGTIVARGWTGTVRRMPTTFGVVAGTMISVQVIGFVGLELFERAITGAPLGDLATGHLLVIGMIVQAIVALAGSAIAVCLARASDRLADAEGTAPDPLWRPDPLVLLIATPDAARSVDASVAHPGRAPPSL